jgi:hypothetical protein
VLWITTGLGHEGQLFACSEAQPHVIRGGRGCYGDLPLLTVADQYSGGIGGSTGRRDRLNNRGA